MAIFINGEEVRVIPDDNAIFFGTDQDAPIVLNSVGLVANTALTNIIVGSRGIACCFQH